MTYQRNETPDALMAPLAINTDAFLNAQARPHHPDDLIQWPDGTFCPASDLADYTHMSDDYRRIPYDSPEWITQTERNLFGD